MDSLVRYTLVMVLVAASAAAGRSAQVRVYAKVDADTTIYPGDEFVYSIVVEGGPQPNKIDLSPLAQFSPRRAGSGTSMQTVGDRTVVSYSENYVVGAGAAGKMVLPGVTVVVDGRTYTTNPVEVTVSQPGTTDRLSLELALSETRCYVGQPVVMTVKWVVTTRVEGGAFSVPVFRSNDFYIEDLSEPATGQAAQQVMIDGVPITVVGQRQLVRGMEAEVISFRKVLIPKRAGGIRLDPITVSTNMATGRVRTGDFFSPYQIKYERVSVKSDPVELEVLPLPEQDKPPQFYGLVGQYTISATAVPTNVNVGDPITLTIRIGGSPFLKPVQWPELEQVTELAANFKIPAEKASPILDGGDKVFTQTIRANNDAVTAVPSIPLAYFDPQRGQYTVARTEPIPLEVAPTKVLTNADVEGTRFTPVNREVEAIRKGISANYYGPEVLVNQRFSLASAVVSPAYMVIWAVPLAGLIAASVAKLSRRTNPQSLARRRRRQASGTAMRQLKTILSADPGERHERLAAVLKGYIGDRFDRVAASLTADDCHRVIVESTGDARAAAQCRNLLAACEAMRYARIEGAPSPDRGYWARDTIGAGHVRQAEDIIYEIERHLKK